MADGRSRRPPTHRAPRSKSAHFTEESSLRSCVGCRGQFDREQLLRIVLDPDGTTPRLDYLGKLPGRGAYVCANPSCISTAVERGGLRRAFRSPVVITAEVIMREAWLAARKQIRSLLAIASRAGKLAVGNSRVEQCLRQSEGELLLIAVDASSGVQRKFRQWAEREGMLVRLTFSKAELGAATGASETSLVVISDPGLAQKIEQEVQRARRLIVVDEL